MMNIKNALIKVYNKSMIELLEELGMDSLDKDEQEFCDLKRNEMISLILEDECSEEDKYLILDNLILYKRLFTASISGNDKDFKLINTELLKNRNKK